MNNHRGQIGETMTWVAATIVIIVILSISIFIVKFNLNQKEFNPFISNDLVATKSAVSFLSYENNFDDLKGSINSEDYTSVKPKIEKFLEAISTDKLNWNFFVLVNGEPQTKSFLESFFNLKSEQDSSVHSSSGVYDWFSYFTFDLENKRIILKFDGGKNE